VQEAGNYSVTVRSITDACTVNGGAVTLAHHIAPKITAFEIDGEDRICSVNPVGVNLKIETEGTPIFKIGYNNPILGTQTINMSGTSQTESVLEVGTYTLVSLEDGNGCIGTTGLNLTTKVTPVSVPDPSVTVADNVVCDGAYEIMTAIDNAGNPISALDYQWYYTSINGGTSVKIPGATNNTYTATQSGAYAVVMNVDGLSTCLGASGAVQQKNIDIPSVTITPGHLTVEEGLTATYTASPNNSEMTYTWTTEEITSGGVIDNEGTNNPIGLTKDVGNYIVRVEVQSITDPNECPEKTAEAGLTVYGKIAIPNVFTPNEDGEGDTWNLDAVAVFQQASVRIYNRWGNLVYESLGGYEKPWDGKYNGGNSPDGVYFYVIELNEKTVEPNKFSGHVQVIR
jgi:gliding motility-associated-like protein